MPKELPFEGFRELIQNPLEQSDPKSFHIIRRFFLDVTSSQPNPFSLLIQRLSGRNVSNREAIAHWRHILEHKGALESALGRRVGVQATAADYFDQIGAPETVPGSLELQTKSPEVDAAKLRDEWMERIYAPGYHIEKLKEELQRARRYKHALSVIMLDIDEFSKINEKFSYQVGDRILTIVVKIIKKTIRTVDILTRYSGDRFMIILPNTNKREAMELAERLRQNVSQRTKRVEGLPQGVTLTLSVGQSGRDDSSADFMKRLEHALTDGKQQQRNKVYSM